VTVWWRSKDREPEGGWPAMNLCCWANIYKMDSEYLPAWLVQEIRDNGMKIGPVCPSCRTGPAFVKRDDQST
jgi:hypothetical protein